MNRTIFDEVNLGHLHLKNRLVRSATWEALAARDGSPSQEQTAVYEDLAAGGAGCIITGFTSIDDQDGAFGGMARISRSELIHGWAQIAKKAHAGNVPIIMQLAMGEFVRDGRCLEPDDLSRMQIAEVARLFGDAAGRAKEAGYDGVQIHAAHGFYLSRFISPAYNHRRDEYGGAAGRTKLLLDVLKEVRDKARGLHVTMKINCSDFLPGGLTPDEALSICLKMEHEGLDSVEVSGNGTSVSGVRAGINEGYFLPFARKLKQICSLPVILVGGHRSVENMNKIVNDDGIDLLSLSRPFIREPALINRWQSGDTSPSKCISCNMCYNTPGHKCIFVLRGEA